MFYSKQMIYDDNLYVWLGIHNKNWTLSGNYKSQDSSEKFLFKYYCFWIALSSEKKKKKMSEKN